MEQHHDKIPAKPPLEQVSFAIPCNHSQPFEFPIDEKGTYLSMRCEGDVASFVIFTSFAEGVPPIVVPDARETSGLSRSNYYYEGRVFNVCPSRPTQSIFLTNSART
jgi:hypothetical protein